jgi:hypothetical protein
MARFTSFANKPIILSTFGSSEAALNGDIRAKGSTNPNVGTSSLKCDGESSQKDICFILIFGNLCRPKADMGRDGWDVRFIPKSGHSLIG